MIVQSSVVYMADKSRIIINDNNSIESMSDNKTLEYCIKNYDMQLTLDNALHNKCNIKLGINSSKINEIEFSLNKMFKINKVKINNEAIDYSRNKNKFILHTKDFKFKNNQDVNITLEYTGKIYAENTLGTNIIYVSYNAVNLLSNIIDWYPKILNNEETYYNVDINSSSRIYSNLPIYSEENKNLSSNLKIKGKSKGLNIVSGNYNSYVYKNIEVIVPKNISKFLMNSSIDYTLNEELINYIKDNKNIFSKSEIDRIKNKDFKKIIVVPYGSIDIDIFGDTLILSAPD